MECVGSDQKGLCGDYGAVLTTQVRCGSDSACWEKSGLAVSNKCEEDEVCAMGFFHNVGLEFEGFFLGACAHKDDLILPGNDLMLYDKDIPLGKNVRNSIEFTLEEMGECRAMEWKHPEVGEVKKLMCICDTDNCIGTIHGQRPTLE